MKTEHFNLLTKVSRVFNTISNLILNIHFGLGFLLYSYSDRAENMKLHYEGSLLFMLFLILGPIQAVAIFALSVLALNLWTFLLYFLLAAFLAVNAILNVRVKMHSYEINPSKDKDSNY